jgi:hypothetical protein
VTRPLDLWIARSVTLGPVVLAFPVASAAVFVLGTDRNTTADALAVCYSLGLFLAFTTSFWPLPSLRSWTRFERITSCCLLFMIVSFATHLRWEPVWLVFHDAIRDAHDAAWAYPWWAYIDGGDLRFAQPSSTMLTMELLSVTNGLVGATGLYLWLGSGRTDRRGVLLCMATAVVHLYSASLYYLSEIVDGLPNVDTSSFLDSWIKFGLANAPWVVFPWLVLYWGQRIVLSPSAEHPGAGSETG